MSRSARRCLARVVATLLWSAAAYPALAQQMAPLNFDTPAVDHPGKKKITRAPKQEAARPAASGNLNAPSTDFSNVEPQIDDPRQRHGRSGSRPPINASVDSDGRPVMGLGF